MNKEMLKKFSDNVVQIAFEDCIKKNVKVGILFLLFGQSFYKIEAYPGAGHNTEFVLNSIYDYAKKNPDLNIEEIYKETLNRAIDFVEESECFVILMEYFYIELRNQKNKVTPFDINVKTYLEKIKNKIFSSKKMQDDLYFNKVVSCANEYLNEKYGKSIF